MKKLVSTYVFKYERKFGIKYFKRKGVTRRSLVINLNKRIILIFFGKQKTVST